MINNNTNQGWRRRTEEGDEQVICDHHEQRGRRGTNIEVDTNRRMDRTVSAYERCQGSSRGEGARVGWTEPHWVNSVYALYQNKYQSCTEFMSEDSGGLHQMGFLRK